jgi:Na+-transporting methylmalonyl-CoA/oxaloacetate decarboxylase gamma subunit
MQNLTFSFQNIIQGDGLWISITGMLIVFSALLFISIFLSVLQKFLKMLEKKFPGIIQENQEQSGNNRENEIRDNRIIAAISYILHRNYKS